MQYYKTPAKPRQKNFRFLDFSILRAARKNNTGAQRATYASSSANAKAHGLPSVGFRSVIEALSFNSRIKPYNQAMPEIALVTLNAKYAHASFGLRYLLANLPEPLRHRASLLEFDISQRTIDVLDCILDQSPRIVGIGVYIWNASESRRLVADLKRVRPDIIVIVGGPEVSHETEPQQIVRDADYVITGEADLAFGQLCEKLLGGKRPLMKIIPADLPEFAEKARRHEGTEARRGEEAEARRHDELALKPTASSPPSCRRASVPPCLLLPYHLYTDEDLANRVVYVEASRGCPFKCEFCLSSLDVPVRNVPIEAFLAEMQKLLDRGCRRFKFVDRTFNLNLNISRSILQFFLDRYFPGLFLHFEMIPDRLPTALRELIAQFQPGALQFEVGVQTFNEEVAARISRKQNNDKLADNLRFLRDQTGVHVHADLIAGLPGETIESFARGFDRLIDLGPQEIQVGILKRLRGTPIVRHDREFAMVYSPNPPYEVLQTGAMDFRALQRMRRFSRFWDLIGNSGNFIETTPLILKGARAGGSESAFWSFMHLSDWLFETTSRKHAIALTELVALIQQYLSDVRQITPRDSAEALWRDYQRGGRSDCPPALRPHVTPADTRIIRNRPRQIPQRQARHLS
jgi:radical SAM superfamily enzyme YgiQ (UPF0313 family)